MKLAKPLLALVYVLTVAVFIACSENNESNKHSNKFHKSQFLEKGNLWKESEFESLLRQNPSKSEALNAVGRSLQVPGVGLVFDEEGYLYTPTQFNQLVEEITTSTGDDTGAVIDQLMDVYYTDLNTYADVTSDPNAVVENTIGIAPLDSSDEFTSPYYVLDMYQEAYLPKESKLNKLKAEASLFMPKGIEKLSGTPNPPPGIVFPADVVIADRKGSAFGHAGVVIIPGFGNSLQGAMMMEAVGNRKHKADEVVSRPSDKYFFRSDLTYMKICYRENITIQQRSDITKYVVAQDPDPYSIWTSKDTGGKWYCSKLPWRAYKLKVGCNIDEDGGFWVTPFDIAGDASLKGSYYWHN
ncbi:MAG TPA: hypothetical protein PLH27_02985 [bacterium]|nr:hypothetical protein [bacterium]HND75425.1 hypothetical protein [Saprospiraceae bacterium]HMY36003.1 hypothetical protein [bacterium]HMZ05526.1 hypothetical protein [bacterium]HNB09917.1 hypothetical protein [bacterium]